MSRRTIRIVDLLCNVANWDSCLAVACDADERARWTKKRDKKFAALKAAVAALTFDELDLIRRLYHPQRLAAQLREVGVEPRW